MKMLRHMFLIGLAQGSEAFLTLRRNPTSFHQMHRDPVISGQASTPISSLGSFSRRVPGSCSTHLAAISPSVLSTATSSTVTASNNILVPGSWQTVSLFCLLPASLGFWKREYGTGYGVALATAWTAATVLPSVKGTPAVWHAAALLFYGVRLSVFLLFRECTSRKIRRRIRLFERAAFRKQKNRLQRMPFILATSCLYGCLVAPLFLSAQVVGVTHDYAVRMCRALIGMTWFGFLLAAAADTYKTVVKINKGEDHLVRGFVFQYFQCPSYLGELMAWTCSFAAGLVAVAAQPLPSLLADKLKLLGLVLAGFAGIVAVEAISDFSTTQLQKTQRKTYGGTEEYEDWIQKSRSRLELFL